MLEIIFYYNEKITDTNLSLIYRVSKTKNKRFFCFKKFGSVQTIKEISYSKIPSNLCYKIHYKKKYFENEYKNLSKLCDVDGIIPLYGFNIWKKSILLKICDTDLFNFLVFNFKEVQSLFWYFFCKIGNIIKECHKKNIIHNDIKLENICIDFVGMPSPKVYLIDFGNSVYTKTFNKKNHFAYTSKYISPETTIENNSLENLYLGDWWCFGIMMFIIITGKYPFKHNIYTIYEKREYDLELIVDKKIILKYKKELDMIKIILNKNTRGRKILQKLDFNIEPEKILKNFEDK